MTFMDSENYKEVIFPETRKAGAYGIQRKSIPFFPRGSWNGIAPTITMLDRSTQSMDYRLTKTPNSIQTTNWIS